MRYPFVPTVNKFAGKTAEELLDDCKIIINKDGNVRLEMKNRSNITLCDYWDDKRGCNRCLRVKIRKRVVCDLILPEEFIKEMDELYEIVHAHYGDKKGRYELKRGRWKWLE